MLINGHDEKVGNNYIRASTHEIIKKPEHSNKFNTA